MAIGGWLTGQWMTGGIEPDSVHPGYYLHATAGGLIGANAAVQVRLHALAFSYAAAASDALVWLAIKKPPAATGYAVATHRAEHRLRRLDRFPHGGPHHPPAALSPVATGSPGSTGLSTLVGQLARTGRATSSRIRSTARARQRPAAGQSAPA
jgi:hypothetical protein